MDQDAIQIIQMIETLFAMLAKRGQLNELEKEALQKLLSDTAFLDVIAQLEADSRMVNIHHHHHHEYHYSPQSPNIYGPFKIT